MRLIFLVASGSAIDRARPRNRLELETEKIHNLGQHNDPISSMNYSQDTSACLFSCEVSLRSSRSRCFDYGLLGSHRPLLGSTGLHTTSRLARATGTRLLHGPRREPSGRRDGQPALPHLRHPKDGEARADAGKQLEVHDASAGVYVGRTR